MPPREISSPLLMQNAKFYFQDADGNLIELRGIVTDVTFALYDPTIESRVAATIEMEVAQQRVLQSHEIPREECYEEWERMILNGLQ